ncbi:unnamed protein product [Phytophthora lilii]|uniref:Unnamed protein product n=1 Tax=Phytophthora lilii TaxID=2077276 RepID=A0A9W6X3T3_9STRA|nr:unnamed protein product [Phytophthora lilii]
MLVQASVTNGVVYALAPAEPLPTIDLSKSIRGQLLSARDHSSIHRFLTKYHRPLLFANMIAMLMNIVVTGVDALTGQILSVISLALWLPMGIAATSTLRYDIVRLIVRTFDFWFFSCTTTLTALMISTYFWDLRFCRMIIDWIGFHNIVFIDGQVRGIRHLVIVTILGIPPLVFVLFWIMLDRLDGCTSFSVLSHRNKPHFSLSGVDIIGNYMITLSLLITKIVARKRQALHLRQRSSVIECVIYRCGLKLKQIEESRNCPARNARPTRVTARNQRIAITALNANTSSEPRLIQQMMFVKFTHTFDSKHVMLPLRVADGIVVFLYVVGIVGLVLSISVFVKSESMKPNVLLMRSAGGLFCTLLFVVPFVALYQRDLFKLLVTSFDFLFYAFQATAATLSVCILYDWEQSRCLMLLTWWIWIHWALTLDALTPIMRHKLRFRPRMAAPIVACMLLGHIAVICRVFFIGDEKLHDAVLYQGVIWDHQLAVPAMPFYFSRIVTLSLWCPRLIWRLSIASKLDVTIIRGSVCYDNYFAKHGRRRSRGRTMHERKHSPSLHRGQVKPTLPTGHSPHSGTTLKSLVAIQPQAN